jgi:hypothetical protein
MFAGVMTVLLLVPAGPAGAEPFVIVAGEMAAQVGGAFEIAGREEVPGAPESWSVEVTSAEIGQCFPAAAGGSDYLAITGRAWPDELGGVVHQLAAYTSRQVTARFTSEELRQCLARFGKQLPTDRYRLTSGAIRYTNPAAIRAHHGDYDLFSIDGYGTRAPFVRRYTQGVGWTTSALIGNEPLSGVAPLRMADWSAQLYVAGRDQSLMVGTLTSNWGWLGWTGPGGQIRGRPAPVLLPDGYVAVFVQGINHRLYEAVWRPDGTFRGWINLGGPAQRSWSGPAAASTGGGRVTVVVNTAPTGLATRSYSPAGGWGAWQVISGRASDDLSATSPAPGQIDLYVRGFGAGTRPLYVRHAVNGLWAPWQNLGGDIGSGGPFAAVWGGESIVWLAGSDTATYQRIRHTTIPWTTWIKIPSERP